MKPGLESLLQRADIWRGGDAVQRRAQPAVATGRAPLDAQLPGGGLPLGALTELLIEHRGIGELRLLMPLLTRLSREKRLQIWVDPPYLPYAPALAAAGIDLKHLLVVQPAQPAEALWALEQALRSGACGAVLGWLREADGRRLRRLQLAAEEGQALGLLFRPLSAARQPSPAALRLQLDPGGEEVAVRILKRRAGRAKSDFQRLAEE